MDLRRAPYRHLPPQRFLRGRSEGLARSWPGQAQGARTLRKRGAGPGLSNDRRCVFGQGTGSGVCKINARSFRSPMTVPVQQRKLAFLPPRTPRPPQCTMLNEFRFLAPRAAGILQEPIHSMPFNIGLGEEGGAGRSRHFMVTPPACPGRNHNSRSPGSRRLFCKPRRRSPCIFGPARAAVGKKVPFWRTPFWQRSCAQAPLNAAWLLEHVGHSPCTRRTPQENELGKTHWRGGPHSMLLGSKPAGGSTALRCPSVTIVFRTPGRSAGVDRSRPQAHDGHRNWTPGDWASSISHPVAACAVGPGECLRPFRLGTLSELPV